MNKSLKFHLISTISIALLILIFNTTQNSISFICGSLLIFANLAILFWVWQRIISKKLIALAVSVIVIKYAIFGVIIYLILKNPNIQPIWFSIGIGMIIITSLLTALDTNDAEAENLSEIKSEKRE